MKGAGTLSVVFLGSMLLAAMPTDVHSYGGLSHEWVVIQGFDLFKCPGPESCDCPKHYYPELEFPLDHNEFYPWWRSTNPDANMFTRAMVGNGSELNGHSLGGAEDSHNHNGWDLPIDNTVTHFWDGDNDDDLATNDFLGGILYDIPNAFDNARRLLKQARELYLAGDKLNAYDYLSHAIHLVGDMTVPAHSHVVDHGALGDSYDDWVKYPEDVDSTFSKNHALWNSDNTRGAGPIAIPENAQSIYTGMVQGNDDGRWPPTQLGAELYYLMYTANQHGDYFGCQGQAVGMGSDGDEDDRRGWMNYGAPPFSSIDDPPRTEDRLIDNSEVLMCVISPTCPFCSNVNPTCFLPVGSVNDDDGDLTKIASANLPYAYRAAAALIKSFRDSIDNVPPTSAISLEGTAGHDGWFRSDVRMTLSGTDNLVIPPEMMINQWRFAATTGNCWFETNTHLFMAEGITQVRYRSIDGRGNEESPLTADVKIDKTDPVISIASPSADGFYLTSDTLTIDFEVTDALSGVYAFSAKLDGSEVSDGQVFDLDDMGGWHTFTVQVEDYAGNTSFQSFEFSIKIDATVAVNPVNLNAKSQGNPVTAFIEFPPGYDVGEIDVPETTLSPKIGWMLMAAPSPTGLGDFDRDGVPDRMVKFSRQDFLWALGEDTGNIDYIIQGLLNNGTEFYGEGALLVFNPGK